ncbi:hypothetical protein C810_01355 [Lachnospiraceae bacterium A2]|nr:hypothetical protein C810_01355 [Lachnospiraceae bacterium A2]
MNEVKMFENEEIGIFVRTVLNDDGSISVNAEDTAIGLGWVDTSQRAADGSPLVKVRWARMNGYCEEFGFTNKLGKDDYIPESLFYMLAMKASNAKAVRFQQWIAMKVVPSIRKNGSYSLQQRIPDSYTIENPVERAKRWIEEQEEHNEQIAEKDKVIAEKDEKIAELEPDADCFRKLCDTRSLICFRDAANLLGMSQTQFTGYLVREKYIYKKGKEDYRPTEPYRKSDLFRTKSYVNRNSGYSGIQTCLTPKGLQYFKLAFEAQGIFPDALPKHGGRNTKKK